MDRLYYLTPQIPAGTPQSAPVSTPWPLEDNQLIKISIEVPDGHCGLTGVRILWSQQQIVPFANNSFFVANDRTIDYQFDDYITSSGLVVQGFNTDIFPHTFYITALITNLPLPGEEPEAEVVTAGQNSDLSLLPPDDLNINTILASTPVTGAPVPPLGKDEKPPLIRRPGFTVTPYQAQILKEREHQADKVGSR
jgi:hypothetical protein